MESSGVSKGEGVVVWGSTSKSMTLFLCREDCFLDMLFEPWRSVEVDVGFLAVLGAMLGASEVCKDFIGGTTVDACPANKYLSLIFGDNAPLDLQLFSYI